MKQNQKQKVHIYNAKMSSNQKWKEALVALSTQRRYAITSSMTYHKCISTL